MERRINSYVKRKTSNISRSEYEYEIPTDDAIELLNFCDSKVEKYRHRFGYANHTWEIDYFLGANLGLVVAEIELKSEDEIFSKPNWIAKEVSNEPKYYNVNLIKNPFKNW